MFWNYSAYFSYTFIKFWSCRWLFLSNHHQLFLFFIDIYVFDVTYLILYCIWLGAAAAKIDSILITADGVHKDELENTRNTQELTNYGNDIRYAVSTNKIAIPQPLPKSLISKVCDLCDREKTARPTFILEHCKY